MDSDRGFLGSLVDFSFDSTISGTLIRVLYGLWMLGGGVAAFFIWLVFVQQRGSNPILGLLVVIFLYFVFLVILRFICESMMTLGKIAEYTRTSSLLLDRLTQQAQSARGQQGQSTFVSATQPPPVQATTIPQGNVPQPPPWANSPWPGAQGATLPQGSVPAAAQSSPRHSPAITPHPGSLTQAQQTSLAGAWHNPAIVPQPGSPPAMIPPQQSIDRAMERLARQLINSVRDPELLAVLYEWARGGDTTQLRHAAGNSLADAELSSQEQAIIEELRTTLGRHPEELRQAVLKLL